VQGAQRDALQTDLERLADGDREAFHPVFVRLWPLLRGYTARHLPWEDAEDAAQEALVKVFSRAAEFDPRRDALSWVLGVAAYEIKTSRRKRQRRREADGDATELLVGVPASGRGPEETAMALEWEGALAAALASLGPADAATLRDHAAGARPEVAAATFRKRVQRALVRLRAAWRTSHGRP
jgi:RNA polymerase sigma-70 factor (ECF subfamily)